MSALNSKFLITLWCGVFLAGCVTTTQLSPQQRRSMQVKYFENTDYNHVFRAFKTVLQDEGYIIKNQDMKGGLIVAHNSKPVSTGWAKLSDALTGERSNYQTGTVFEVSVNLEPIRKNYVESRLIIQKMDSYSMGGSQGMEIINPALYQNLYAKVRVEIERRKAQGK